ncbi:U6 snRNA-associated Sm-like protein LSm7 [Phlyctochytrium arcticum]|nr:U6 snRNA-associated Sm-like protein LSm7 [Phlyctochytrium arcticum]
MADRGRSNNRGRGGPNSRGASRGGRGGHGGGGQKKENILDLQKHMDKKIHVKYTGGREVIGTLKGFDQLLNLVLDDTEEFVRDPEDNLRITDKKRTLGLVVSRGTAIVVIYPLDGTEEIANPFAQQE